MEISVHRKLSERLDAARMLVKDKGLQGIVTVDGMQNQVTSFEIDLFSIVDVWR